MTDLTATQKTPVPSPHIMPTVHTDKLCQVCHSLLVMRMGATVCACPICSRVYSWPEIKPLM